MKRKISGKNSGDNNLIRENIIKYFPDRDCVTLVRPVEQETELQKLNDIPYEKLKPTFKWEFKQLKDKIYKETVPKKINGKKLTGRILAQLIIEFVNTINSGSIPNINNSWDSVINKDIKDYYEKALIKFKTSTKKLSENIFEQEDIIKYIYDYKLDSLMIYNKLFQLNQDTFSNFHYLDMFNQNKDKLEHEMSKFEEIIVKTNLEKSNTLCRELLKNEFKEIDKKMYDGFYTSKVIDDFIQDYKDFCNNYQDKCKGLNKTQILINYLIQSENNIIKYFVKKIE